MFPSIYTKIRWAFGVPTLVMFAIFWATIYIAENQLEIISLEHWLDTEYARYYRDYQQLGDNAPVPNPYEFFTYDDTATLPHWLSRYTEPGFYGHRVEGETTHFLVRPHPSQQGLLYIVFQEHADDYLDEYEARLHLMTFILGLIVTTSVLIYSIYFMRSLSAPLAAIEKKIPKMSPEHDTFEVESQYRETREIEETLLKSKIDIAHYFQREQDFSRFASHELRTPITVVKGSSEILQRLELPHPLAQKAINRINSASEEMSLLTDTFLLLGKAHIEQQYWEDVDISALIETQLEKLTSLNPEKQITYHHHELVTVKAPTSFVVITLNNLLKNAIAYTVEKINIQLSAECLCISNDYADAHQVGYGCGLVIVERICERLNWALEVHSQDNKFTISIHFQPINESSS